MRFLFVASIVGITLLLALAAWQNCRQRATEPPPTSP
jgi:hypothetical protein